MALYRPSFQSNFWLGVMALVFIGLSYWSDQSLVEVRPADYGVRTTASETMLKALRELQDYRFPEGQGSRVTDGVDSMLIVFTMLGEKDSPITTDEGRLEDKITVLNPNYAAAMVDLMDRAGVHSGDTIAVLLTGSMPGANIALLSAAKEMKVHPVVITSIGSSWWGANTPDFTWLDMERVLIERHVFPEEFRSIAASAGGSDDNGGLRLSDLGRTLITDAVDRNKIALIQKESLTENINARIKLFESIMPLDRYKAVVNVGGGIAAIGHPSNGDLIPNGVNKVLQDKNYPSKTSVIHAFAREHVPVIHIYDVSAIAKQYALPLSQLPLPEVGKGRVFEYQRYDLTYVSIALFLMFLILVVIKYLDWKAYQWREQKVDMDTID